MTLNDLERLNSPYFVFFFSQNSITLLDNYVTVVEDRHDVRKIFSPSHGLPLLAILTNPAVGRLTAIAELLVSSPKTPINTYPTVEWHTIHIRLFFVFMVLV